MTKNVDSQNIEEQSYQVGLINNLVDIAQDNLNVISESLVKYRRNEFNSKELICDLEYALPKIDTLLKVAFEKSSDSKDQLYQLALNDIHCDIDEKDGD